MDVAPQFEHLAPTAADAARELAGAQGVWVCVRRRRNRDAVLRHTLGIEARHATSGEVPIGADPLIELAVLAGRDLFIPDYAVSDVYDPLVNEQGVISVAAAPIAAGGQELGALIAFRTKGEPFGPDDAARLAQAGTALAVVLTAHEARREHARALARERLLARAAFETASAPALGVALQRTAEGAADVSDAVFAAVIVADEEGSRIAGATAGPVRDDLTAVAGGHLRGVRLAGLTELVSVESLAAGRPLLFVDALALFARLGLPTRSHDVRGRLAVLEPIAEADGVYGAILVLLEADSPDPAVFGSLETLASNAVGVIRRARLHREVEGAYLSTVTALANALEAKDAHTHEHASETARLAVDVGRELGLDASDLRDLEFAAVLHDVGKIAIPEAILNRDGPLTPAERLLIEEHTVIGERILRGIPFLASAATAVRSAHERWDGRGYPDAIGGETIPLLSRVIFSCDTWDVMTSDRPYRPALELSEARRRLAEAAGSQLDPTVVGALERVLDRRGGGGRGAARRGPDAIDRAAA